MTLEEIGLAMGYKTPKSAKSRVSELLNLRLTIDPQVSTVLRFSEVIDCEPASFFEYRGKGIP